MNSSTDANGNTVTVTTTVVNGRKETKRTVTAPNGKVISETTEGGDGGEAPAPNANGKAWFGIHTAELPAALRDQLEIPENEGVLVQKLAPDSPAGRAGIQQNDIILRFELVPVNSPDTLKTELSKHDAGDKVVVEYLHKGQRNKATVTLGKRADLVGEADARASAPQANTKASTRILIVDPDGKIRVIGNKQGGDAFSEVLKDPNVPETMKESLRKMQEQMREFNKRTGETIPEKKKAK